jgi:photosystem II stability/assembly factor-like uncharacterized protein
MPSAVHAVDTPASTWVALTSLPGSNHGTIFGLAVNPTNTSELVAGDSSGSIYRSGDAGTTWSRVFSGKSPVLTIAYDPLTPNLIVAGRQSGGALISEDSGAHWIAATGMEQRSVREVAFARSMIVAATDKGVFTSTDGSGWTASGLGTSIDAVAVLAVNDPVRIVAGGDTSTGSVPMYMSTDGGATWSNVNPAINGTIVTHLAAGPVNKTSGVRPLVVGTNTGLFISTDNGSTYTALTGAQLLPSVDYTQAAFTSSHFDRFYVASDGGGGESGGLWATADSGQHFSSLLPPEASVTALAVSSDEQPVLYVATFRAADHTVSLWAYRDTGGTPQGPFISPSPSVSAARTNTPGTSFADFLRSLVSSQVPYIALGVIALLVILLAAVSQFRARRR